MAAKAKRWITIGSILNFIDFLSSVVIDFQKLLEVVVFIIAFSLDPSTSHWKLVFLVEFLEDVGVILDGFSVGSWDVGISRHLLVIWEVCVVDIWFVFWIILLVFQLFHVDVFEHDVLENFSVIPFAAAKSFGWVLY